MTAENNSPDFEMPPAGPAPGEKLGPYRIDGMLGAGGMGRVFRATDTRLGRAVAIKVCAEEFAGSFAREAKAISSLNHPNICALYDVGPNYLVMELVEGETLASRLKKGPLSPESATRYSLEIAAALEQAHAAGIIHRDLKPANIMLTKSGVKVLDFGLARLTHPSGTDSQTATAATVSDLVIGTVPYMAPEQLEGRQCDARTDIFALGLVACEMATGKRVFTGETQAALIAAVMRCQMPDTDGVPAPLRRAIQGSLALDPADRWHSAREFQIALKIGGEPSLPAGVATVNRNGERWVWAAVTTLLVVALILVGWRTFSVPRESPTTNYLVTAPPNSAFAAPPGPSTDFMAISPDGRSLVFPATVGGKVLLFLRPRDSASAHALTGTDGAYAPFWSPDSKWIAFFAAGKLKKVRADGSVVQDICDAPTGGMGSWGSQGDILVSAVPDLFRVREEGGAPTPYTLAMRPNEMFRSWPHFLPDGRRFLYVSLLSTYRHAVYVSSLESGPGSPDDKFLLEVSSRAQYAPPGYLFFVRDGTLLAQRFNDRDLRLEGDAIPIADHIEYFKQTAFGMFSVSADALAYQLPYPPSRLAWRNRQGTETRSVERTARYFGGMRLSPVEQKLAIPISDPRTGVPELHILDLLRGTLDLFTPGPGAEVEPVWSADGRTLAFASDREGPIPRLYRKALDDGGSGTPLLPSTPGFQSPLDWSKEDGLVYLSGETAAAIWVFPAQGRPWEYLPVEGNLAQATLAPNGRWLAYVSDVTGRPEVYVQSFPKPGERHLISNAGGFLPRWNRDGKELFYLEGTYIAGERLMAVPVSLQSTFSFEKPALLFSRGTAPFIDFEVMPDGKEFLMNSGTGLFTAPITVVTNWTAALKR